MKRDLLEKREEDSSDCRVDEEDKDERGGDETRTEYPDMQTETHSPE